MTQEAGKVGFFNDHAERWDDEPPSAQRLNEVADRARLNPGDVVVDVGCGTGVLVPCLLDRVGPRGAVVAMDPAESMLARLQAKAFGPRVTVRRELFEETGLADASADAVVCFQVFPHFESPERVFDTAFRVLRQGGRFLVAHVHSRDEINAFHGGLDGPVREDRLPSAATMVDGCDRAGLCVELYIDEPGRYALLARKAG